MGAEGGFAAKSVLFTIGRNRKHETFEEMKGFEWLLKENLFGPVKEKHRRILDYDFDEDYRMCTQARLIDYVANIAARDDETALLRVMLDKGAFLDEELMGNAMTSVGSEFVIIDAGYIPSQNDLHESTKNFIDSRDSARLAAILAMRAIRRLGSIYRDPARMVGRAIWASRAYYLEESERALKK